MSLKSIYIGIGALVLILYYSITFTASRSSKQQLLDLKDKTDDIKNKNISKLLERFESEGVAYFDEGEREEYMDELGDAAKNLTGIQKEVADLIIKTQSRVSGFAGKHEILLKKLVEVGGMYDPESMSSLEAIEDRLKMVHVYNSSSEDFLKVMNNIPFEIKKGLQEIDMSNELRQKMLQSTLNSYQYEKNLLIRKYDVKIAKVGIELLNFLKLNYNQWEYEDGQIILPTDQMVEFINEKTTLLNDLGEKQNLLIKDVLQTELRKKEK